MSSKIPRSLEKYVTAFEGVGELAPPEEVLEGTEVLGLGEATHGTKEFFELKGEISLSLADEEFKLFIWEAPFSETLKLNEYVLRGEGDPEEALKDMSYGIWQTEEVLEMVESCKEHNKGRDESQKVKFYGFDVNRRFPESIQSLLRQNGEKLADEYEKEFKGRFISEVEEERLVRAKELLQKARKAINKGKLENISEKGEEILRHEIRATEQGVEMAEAPDYGPGSAEYAAEFFKQYLREVDPEFLDRERERFSELEEAGLQDFDEERLEELVEFVQELKARLEKREDAYRAEGPEAVYEEAIESQIKNLEKGLENIGVSEAAVDKRDRFMAENIEKTKQKHGSKAVLWAHNGHVRKSNGSFTSMGRYLEESFGSRYFSIGFQFARGSFRAFNSVTEEMEEFEVEASEESLPDNLVEIGVSPFFLNLREAAQEDSLKKWIESNHEVFNAGVSLYSEWDITREEMLGEYDGLIFVEETRSSTSLN